MVRHEGDYLALSFSLANPSERPRTVRYFHPFMQFELHVMADGRELAVSQPEINLPAEPRELQIPAKGRATLESSIRLRFAANGNGDSSFVWTIAGSRTPVELRVTLRLEGEPVAPCTART